MRISTAVVSGIQRHAQYAHVETEAAQQHQTRLQKLCDNFWSRVWFCCSRVRTNQKKVVKTTFQFQAIFPNQTLHQKDVTESAPLRSRRAGLPNTPYSIPSRQTAHHTAVAGARDVDCQMLNWAEQNQSRSRELVIWILCTCVDIVDIILI